MARRRGGGTRRRQMGSLNREAARSGRIVRSGQPEVDDVRISFRVAGGRALCNLSVATPIGTLEIRHARKQLPGRRDDRSRGPRRATDGARTVSG